MNPSRTELIYIGSETQLGKCDKNPISVCSDSVSCSPCIRLLGAWIDQELSLANMLLKCQTVMWNLQEIKNIRDYLDEDSCNSLICSLVLSHLDNANCLLSGVADKHLTKMQWVQNLGAKIVKGKNNIGLSSTNCMENLHWLPSGGSRISHRGGVDLVGGAVDPRGSYVSKILHVKTKNLDP